MSAFAHINWTHPDVWAVLVGRGVGTVEANFEGTCQAWLEHAGYRLRELSFLNGISPVVSQLAQMLRWEEQFGYRLDPESRNLDALNDGFAFDEPNLVLKVAHFERAWLENATWARGFLSIVSDYSLHQLALGKRFFAMLVVEDQSPLIGKSFGEICVSPPFRFSGPAA